MDKIRNVNLVSLAVRRQFLMGVKTLGGGFYVMVLMQRLIPNALTQGVLQVVNVVAFKDKTEATHRLGKTLAQTPFIALHEFVTVVQADAIQNNKKLVNFNADFGILKTVPAEVLPLVNAAVRKRVVIAPRF
jgi:hypothetical protein